MPRGCGHATAGTSLPRRDDDDLWWDWQHVPGSRSVHLRRDNLGTTRAILTFISDVRGLEDLKPADQIAIVRRTFADVGGAAPRILAALDDASLYFTAVGQVRSSTWSRGRIVLLGDAALCNATFGGTGTSLALIEACVLVPMTSAPPWLATSSSCAPSSTPLHPCRDPCAADQCPAGRKPGRPRCHDRIG